MKDQLEQLYQKSIKLKNTQRTEYLEKLLVICQENDGQFYAYLIRFDLIHEYKKTGQIHRALNLYGENIVAYLEFRYDSTILLAEYPWMSRHIDSLIDIQQQEINDFFLHMKKIFEISGHTLRSYYQEYYSYLMRVGRWEEGFSIYSRWMVESRDKVSQSIAKEEADRAYYYFTVGDSQNGKYVFETVKKGIGSLPGIRTYSYARAVKYFFELKDWEMTSYLIHRGYDFSKNRIENLEEVAEIIKPLSVLNPKIAIKIWEKHRYHFKLTENARAKFSYGIASYLLDKSLNSYLLGSTKLRKMKVHTKEMYEIQSIMDERNGTEAYHEEIMYWLDIWKNFNKP